MGIAAAPGENRAREWLPSSPCPGGEDLAGCIGTHKRGLEARHNPPSRTSRRSGDDRRALLHDASLPPFGGRTAARGESKCTTTRSSCGTAYADALSEWARFARARSGQTRWDSHRSGRTRRCSSTRRDRRSGSKSELPSPPGRGSYETSQGADPTNPGPRSVAHSHAGLSIHAGWPWVKYACALAL